MIGSGNRLAHGGVKGGRLYTGIKHKANISKLNHQYRKRNSRKKKKRRRGKKNVAGYHIMAMDHVKKKTKRFKVILRPDRKREEKKKKPNPTQPSNRENLLCPQSNPLRTILSEPPIVSIQHPQHRRITAPNPFYLTASSIIPGIVQRKVPKPNHG